jgi:hypothetical protein
MRLGIYGDSYGSLNLHTANRVGFGTSWIEEFQKIGGYTEVFNFSTPGASLMYCYDQYKKTKIQNDFNIFIIPDLRRPYYPKLENIGLGGNWYSNYHSVKVAQQSFEVTKSSDDPDYDRLKKILDSVVVYHEVWRNSAYDSLLHKAFALNLIQSEENIIFLYTDKGLFGPDKFTLVDLSQWEMNELGWGEIFSKHDIHYGTVQGNKFLTDARICHLCHENNIILAQKIKEAVDRKEKIVHLNKDDYQLPTNHLTYYVKWMDL